METWKIKDHIVEYLDDTHTYLVDGVILPSITQILKVKFGNKYNHVNKEVLQRAATKGTEVHQAIKDYCEQGIESDLVEVRNFKFLQRQYKFKVVENEIPILLFDNDGPIAAGRLDLVLQEDAWIGLGDIKRTSVLDKNYLAYQLNLYRVGYQQSYDRPIDFLKGLHLRDDKRKYVDIPINEELCDEIIQEYFKSETI